MKAITALLLILAAGPAAADQQLRITDGDTIRIGDERIRLWGVDAPERDQTCRLDGRQVRIGARARDELADLIGAEAPACERVDTDRYGRTVARCAVDGLDLGAAMVARGWALDWPAYSGGAYAGEQAEAQADRLGLWAGHCQAPWEHRRQR